MLKKTVATAALAVVPLIGATAAHATPEHATTPVVTTESIAACEIDSAQLKWGTIERWRSYISGSIAHGSWELDGVEYEIPEFVWNDGTGNISIDGKVGNVEFEGSVLFKGHGELLQVTLANPTLEFENDKAYLYLDLTSTTPTGEIDVEAKQEQAVELDLSAANSISASGDTFALVAPGKLTAAGADAFGGFYEADEPVDVVSFTASLKNGCEVLVANTGSDAGDENSGDENVADNENAANNENVADEENSANEDAEGAGTEDVTPGEGEEGSASAPSQDEAGLSTGAWIGIGSGAIAVGIIAGLLIAKGNRKKD